MVFYRYGYQGSERDPEMSGGAGYTTYFRALDPRIGRWLTPDPKVFPWQSPYVSMDGNPVALIDPWGASTGSGEYVDQKTANSGSAAKGAQYKDNTGRVFQNRGEGLGWEEITPPSATANTPSNLAFRNDATQVVNRFIPDLARQDVRRAQVDTDYAKNMTWLNKVGDFLTQFDIPGRGSDENWNGDDLWQIYSEDGGQGQAIRAKGRPLLVDAKTLPF